MPTRTNPADLNIKKISLERRSLSAVLAGLFAQASTAQEDMEKFNIRSSQTGVTTNLVQAMQVLAVTLLHGCCPAKGNELRGVRALHPEFGGSFNVQRVSWSKVGTGAWYNRRSTQEACAQVHAWMGGQLAK